MAGFATSLVGGGGGVIGGASVRLVLDSSQFNAGLASAEGQLKGTAARLQSIGTGMSRLGGTLTRGLTVPIVAAGAVATKMALDFNKAFVQIQTLASQGGHSIAELKSEVLSLAQATGQDPQGLATALYNVLSAGKAAASQAFPILTAAAKGAAIGMGSVQDVAKVLVTTMNAYGPSNISAAQAMDTLTQATTDSAAEADALASSLGPVIGIAAQVGVSFQEIAATIAVATNQGIDAARATTGLRFLLSRLAAETPTATTALKAYGISLGELHKMLTQQGLIATLQTLADKFDLSSVKGQQAWQAITGGARGAAVAATLVGDHAAAATQELNKLNGSAGALNRSFSIWGKTITGQNAVAFGKLRVAAIQLGEKLIPIFEQIVGAVTTLVDAFSSLPGPMQSVVVKGLVIAALAGPFLKLAGIITGLVGKFSALGTAVGGLGAAGGAGAAGGSALEIFNAGLAGLAADAAAAATSIGVIAVAGATAIPVLGAMATDAITSATGLQTTKEAVIQLRGELAAGTITQQEFIAGMRGLGPAAGRAAAELDKEGSAARRASSDLSNITNLILTNTKAQKQWGGWLGHNSSLTDKQSVHLAELTNTLYKYGGSLNAQQKAALRSAIATGDYSTAVEILNGAINHLPNKKQVKIEADTKQAQANVAALQSRINAVHGKTVTITVNTQHNSFKDFPGGPNPSTGAIIGRAAGGGITRMATYMQVGEGHYGTFVGKGSEAVIPFDNRGISILARAMRKAGGGGRGMTININTNGAHNPEELASAVSRHFTRVMREEALV